MWGAKTADHHLSCRLLSVSGSCLETYTPPTSDCRLSAEDLRSGRCSRALLRRTLGPSGCPSCCRVAIKWSSNMTQVNLT